MINYYFEVEMHRFQIEVRKKKAEIKDRLILRLVMEENIFFLGVLQMIN